MKLVVLDEAAASPEAVRDGTDGSPTASSSTPSNPHGGRSALLPPANISSLVSETHGRDGGVLTLRRELRVYCADRHVPARYLAAGWAVCQRCGHRIRVVV